MSPPMSQSAKLVVVIDDDPLVLEATAGLLMSWGCEVVTAVSYDGVLKELTDVGRRPDLIICDYQLSEDISGIEAIAGLRSLFEIPALLISGDPVREKPGSSYYLLQKPLSVARLRAALVGASVLQG